MLNSVLVFAFVYMWHGFQKAHLAWASLNWFGVFVEKIALDIYKRKDVQEFEVSILKSFLNKGC